MVKRIMVYVIGLFMCSFGVALVISADVGAGPWDAVYVAFFRHFGLTVGTWSFCFQVLFVFTAAFLEKKRPDVRIFISSFIGAIFLDGSLFFLLSSVPFSSFFILLKWGVFVVGLFLLALGIRTYVSSGFPKTPEDEIMFALSKRFAISVGLAVLIIDGTGLIVAFCLGGPVGLGSFLSPVVLALFLRLLLKRNPKRNESKKGR